MNLSSVKPSGMRGQLRDHYQTAVSMEGDGVTRQELEYVFYAKIVNPAELEKAESSEHHEQWEIRGKHDEANQFFGSIRVRKTTVDGNAKRELTIKSIDAQSESAGKDEVEIDINDAVFDNFKRIANAGMIKTRYFFPVEFNGHDLTWEVDVYTNPEGKPAEWCKIDLEVPADLEGYPEFPIELAELLEAQPKDRTDEQKAFVDKLMSEQFLQRNAHPATTTAVTTVESLLLFEK